MQRQDSCSIWEAVLESEYISLEVVDHGGGQDPMANKKNRHHYAQRLWDYYPSSSSSFSLFYPHYSLAVDQQLVPQCDSMGQ
jgi:hypothetical protein